MIDEDKDFLDHEIQKGIRYYSSLSKKKDILKISRFITKHVNDFYFDREVKLMKSQIGKEENRGE